MAIGTNITTRGAGIATMSSSLLPNALAGPADSAPSLDELGTEWLDCGQLAYMPSMHNFHQMAAGILGEFSKADVSVEAGKTVNLGTLDWVPVRYGKQIWQIGVPDRSAAEFRHGDHYWRWGLYNLYPQEFPTGVNFVVGRSNWSKDWNYVQPPQKGSDGKYMGTAWQVTFEMPSVSPGKATLRLALCGARGNSVDAFVNGTPLGPPTCQTLG